MMKHLSPAALFCALALALSFTACGAPSVPSDPAVSGPDPAVQQAQPVQTPFALALYPEYSLHPCLAGNRANLTLSPLLYEPLFQVDEHFQFSSLLCESTQVSPDKLVWTFTLRSDVTFSDGTPLTGQIAADALDLARSPQGRYHQRLLHIQSVSAEENTLTITLSRPDGMLPVLLDIPIALGEGEQPLGTGPYVLEQTGESRQLTARSDWWQGKDLPARTIPLHCVSKSDELIFAFGSGSISLVDVDLMGTNALGYSGNYETWDYATTDLIYLGFNAQSGPCRDPALRQAISRSIDRDTVAHTIYANHAVPAALPVHPDSPWHQEDLARLADYDPEPLAQLVEGLRPAARTVTLLVNSENTAKTAVARLIAYQLEAAGMEVTLSALAFEDYTAALADGRFDLYLAEMVMTAGFDPAPLLTGPLNHGGWYSEQTQPLLQSLALSGPSTRADACRPLLELLGQQVPFAPICFKNGSLLTQWGRLSGVEPVRGNVFYQLENWIISYPM